MKNIIILADLEGCCGITDLSNNEFCCEAMAAEVDYIIKTLKELGNYSITVLDCHNDGLTLKKYCSDNNIPFVNHVWSFPVEEKFDAALLVGFHGKEGSNGYLSHTVRADISDLFLGETSIGEVSLLQNWLAFFGVPVIYISGDRAIEDELYHYNGEFLAVKGTEIGAPPLTTQKQEIADALYSASNKLFSPEYCSEPVFVQLISDKCLSFIPPEIFSKSANGIVFPNTVEFIEKLTNLCSYLNIFEQYQFARFSALKKLLLNVGKDTVFQNDQAKAILDNRNWRTLSDDDFLFFYSHF